MKTEASTSTIIGFISDFASLYLSWKNNRETHKAMNDLINYNKLEVELLTEISALVNWSKTCEVFSNATTNIENDYDILTNSKSDFKKWIDSSDIQFTELSKNLAQVSRLCRKGDESTLTKPLLKEFYDLIASKKIDQSYKFAVSTYSYHLFSIYAKGLFAQYVILRYKNTPQSEIDDWTNSAKQEIENMQIAFDDVISTASPKYKTLKNVKSPFELYYKGNIDTQDGSWKVGITDEEYALSGLLMAPDGHIVVGVQFKKSDVSFPDPIPLHERLKDNLGLSISTLPISQLVENNEDLSPSDLTFKTVSHGKDYEVSPENDFKLGKHTPAFVKKYIRLADDDVLTGIKFTSHQVGLTQCLGFELRSMKFNKKTKKLEYDNTNKPTITKQDVNLDDFTLFESLPDSDDEFASAKADSRLIQPGAPSIISGVCIIQTEKCIQIKLETQDWRNLNL